MQLARVGAVLGTATAGGPDASPTVLAALFGFARWASLGPGPGLIPRHTRLHHFVRSAAGETVADGARAGGAPSRHRRPALRLLPRLVQRRGFATRRLLARRISRRPSIASSDVTGARLRQFPGRASPIAHADCGWQAARGGNSPLPRRDIQLQPNAPGDLLASWGRGGVVEGVASPPDPSLAPHRGAAALGPARQELATQRRWHAVRLPFCAAGRRAPDSPRAEADTPLRTPVRGAYWHATQML